MKGPNTTNYGSATGKIKAYYHNGTSAVTGYVVKKLSHLAYIVTTDGVTFYTCKLAQDTASATTLTAGAMTFKVTPPGGGTKEFIFKLQSYKCFTTAGSEYAWVLANPSSAQAQIDVN